MNKVFYQTPLYRYLEYCNREESGTRKILDCGAGGDMPPLSLFYSYGYDTTGIDIEVSQVEKAQNYEKRMDQSLNICCGDMSKLIYDDNTFDFVYSYNSIFHMRKENIRKSILEMRRVLKPQGLMFVNFLSIDDSRCGQGPHLGANQYEQIDDGPVIHSYFDYNEAEDYLGNFEFLLKERRIIERLYGGKRIKQGFIDYIVRIP